MRTLGRVASIAVLAALLVGGIAALAYGWGRTAGSAAVPRQEAAQARAALQAYQADVRRVDQATDRYLADHRALEDRYAQLDREHRALLKRHRLIVPQRTAVAVAPLQCDGGVQRAPDLAADQAGRIELPDAARDADGELQLTLAAVRVWNAALTGRDAPAGACGAAAAAAGADAACAEGSGLGIADAWDNHAANARACAEDRQRYRHLIEFLTAEER
ncbi:hypothetical protein ABXN37_22435 [Piscinibacter sakaiensis]|uniref:Uncharacterized protein n=1 Tax=Piscinibacter sakaiensis TaxID=1547922 RepID=A0A0K8P6N9_PISS1|nr:hypothetical protein [Piscinibacter sakaiensis]GAP37885.1 hypothetical protein ISF6_4079 [Piscinibacter sakaiensis]